MLIQQLVAVLQTDVVPVYCLHDVTDRAPEACFKSSQGGGFRALGVLVLHEIRLDGLELLDLQSVEDRKSLHFSFGELCCCPHILYMVRGCTALEPNCTSIGV